MQQSRNLFGCQVFEPEDLPAGWTCEPLGNRLVLEYGRSLTEANREAGEVVVYGSNGPVGSHNEAMCQAPGVLVGRKGSVGAVHYADHAFWPIDTVYYVVAKEGDNLKFLYYLLQYLPLKNLNAATGVPGLSRRDAYALRGAFPPTDEQSRIVKMLTSVDLAIAATAGFDGLARAQVPLFGDSEVADGSSSLSSASKLDSLIELRRSLMHGLMTGEYRLTRELGEEG